MKKNRMMRLASVMLVMTMLSMSVISGTFAKYTTSIKGEDSARVATWGFTGKDAEIALTDLFETTYNDGAVKSSGADDIIAPGASGSATFQFNYEGQEEAPEVAYKFKVSVDGSTIASSIEENQNIQWKLDNGEYGTWDKLMISILELSGVDSVGSGEMSAEKEYAPGQLPEAFEPIVSDEQNSHTISWQWIFESKDNSGKVDSEQDEMDTLMGNAADLDKVKIVITITAEQINTLTSTTNP